MSTSGYTSSSIPTSVYNRPITPLSPGHKLAYGFIDHSLPMDNRQDYSQSADQEASASQYATVTSRTSPSMSHPPPQHGLYLASPGHVAAPGKLQSNRGIAIDPAMATATSPTYPPHPQYSSYTHSPDMTHFPSVPGMYGRPEWAAQYPGPPLYGHSAATSGPPPPTLVSPVSRPPPMTGHPLSTVYSFVPIPGAQQHKRPRRRYEEIERMYKCGWNGCEKAYGTLNHLNAHVTMQSHGSKRTPEEFKEIRREWKQKKKEEEAARKAEEDRRRQDESRNAAEAAPPAPEPSSYTTNMRQHIAPPSSNPTLPSAAPQLPPIGYTSSAPAISQYPTAPQYSTQSPGLDGAMPAYGAATQIYSGTGASANSFPPSPYSQNNPQLYQQHDGSGNYPQ